MNSIIVHCDSIDKTIPLMLVLKHIVLLKIKRFSAIMRVQKKSPSKKALTIAILSTLILVAGLVTYALLTSSNENNYTPSTSENTRPNTDDVDTKPSDDTSTNSSDKPDHEAEKDISPPYEGENVDNSRTLSGVISYKSVVDGNLVIRTTINQMLGSGTCSLTLSNGQKTVTRSSSIAQNPSSSTCEGFSVPTTELGSGTWDIKVQVSSDGRTGTLSNSISL